jgi:hypothetical protein
MSIQQAAEKETTYASTLLAIERDTPWTFTLQGLLMYTLCTSTLHAVKMINTLHIHTACSRNRYPHVSYLRGWID